MIKHKLYDKIFEMFLEEGIPAPNNLNESLFNYPILLNKNKEPIFKESNKTIFLTIATNYLLSLGMKQVITKEDKLKWGCFVLQQLNPKLHKKYVKLSKELKCLEKEEMR
jgi:hypothetical protein